jgi:ribulose-5-phosphate 4-epimerase/fuculose-1-phosphate aldolase
MTMNAGIPAPRTVVSEAEWHARVDLAASYRLVALFGMDDLVFTHISARVPDEDGHFLINPYGLGFDEMTASSMVKVDAGGRKVMPSPYDINPAGFVIHGAVHDARHDVACVVHTHSVDGVAVACQRDGVLPLSQHSILVLGSLAYHDYEGIALDEDERPRLVRDLGDADYLVLRNHGLLTVGTNIGEAFVRMYLLETACAIQVRAQAGGASMRLLDGAVVERGIAQFGAVTRGAGAAIAWPALRRKLDRIDPSYAN